MRWLTWTSRSVAAVVAAALLVTAAAVGVVPRVWRIANAHDQVPVKLPAFAALSQRSTAYDAKGKVIAIYERENSQPVNLAKVPESVIAAFLAVEDAEYYDHNGFNLRGFVRAVLSNVSSDAPVQGASTITQQVVKNEYLAGLPRDGRYKFLQAHYAMLLENKLTKAQILQRYLSTVYFGNNAYGLQSAAEVYFGKDVSKLTLYEGAFLAGLVRSPTGYDPIRRYERSRARFRQVVDRLVIQKLVPAAQAKTLAETWPIPETTHVRAGLEKVAPTYYSDALRKYLLTQTSILGDTEQERASRLYRGGLKIRTTLDPVAQAAAEKAYDVLPANSRGIQDAIVTLDVSNGAVRAMVGGPGFVPITNEINMALQPRQTGSSIKFFILAAALQAGAQPDDVIDGSRPCSLPSEKGKPFVIDDARNAGVESLFNQTWKSINCAYSRLAQIVGLNRIVDTVYRMANSVYLNRLIPASQRRPIQPYASFATGANEMSPMDMASGMQTLANGGLHHDPYYVERIDGSDGKVVWQHTDKGVQVLDPGVSYTAVNVLKGVLRQSVATGYKALHNFAYQAIGKTGTQDKNTNSWFVGATRQLVTAVWVGNPQSYVSMNGIREFVRAGVPKVQGGTFPAKIWKTAMDGAMAGKQKLDWPKPPGDTRSPARLYLPGNECLARRTGGGSNNDSGNNLRAQAPKPTKATTKAPATTKAGGTATTKAGGATPTTRQYIPPAVYRAVRGGTTIPANVLNPRAPLPSTNLGLLVYTCGQIPSNVVIQRG